MAPLPRDGFLPRDDLIGPVNDLVGPTECGPPKLCSIVIVSYDDELGLVSDSLMRKLEQEQQEQQKQQEQQQEQEYEEDEEDEEDEEYREDEEYEEDAEDVEEKTLSIQGRESLLQEAPPIPTTNSDVVSKTLLKGLAASCQSARWPPPRTIHWRPGMKISFQSLRTCAASQQAPLETPASLAPRRSIRWGAVEEIAVRCYKEEDWQFRRRCGWGQRARDSDFDLEVGDLRGELRRMGLVHCGQTTREARVGELVFAPADFVKTGDGSKRSVWVLPEDDVAVVEEVNCLGELRLRNADGEVSRTFLPRSCFYFVFSAAPQDDAPCSLHCDRKLPGGFRLKHTACLRTESAARQR